MNKKIIITAGGTGGHTFPAQGLAQQLKNKDREFEILFVAGGLKTNRYFDREQFPFQEIVSSPLVSKNPIKLLKGALTLVKGVYQSIKILKKFQPNLVIGFGSYYTVPILMAAKLLRIPILLHEANSIPGKANKWFAPFAICTGIHFPSTAPLLKGRTLEVGLPLRQGYQKDLISADDARSYFKLNKDVKTLLIFGGSQGARAINVFIQEALKNGYRDSLQVIHLTGNEKNVAELETFYRDNGIRHSVKAFESRMDYAWSAANAFIGRSGASTIAEAMEYEIPGLLIPYPHAAENHQEKNADFLVFDVKGGMKLLEKELSYQSLNEAIKKLINEEWINEKKRAIKDYKRRPHKIDLCQLVSNSITL